jgi:hypothetical protein
VYKDLKNVDIIKNKMWSFFDKTYITIFKYKGVLYRLFDDNKYQVFTPTEKLETDIEPSYRYCHFKMNDIIYESVFTTDIMIFVERKQKRRRTLFDLED